MNLSAKITAEYLEEHEVAYTVLGDNEEVISVKFKADNKESIEIKLIFNDENTNVAFKSFNICKVAENKKPMIYKICNSLNEKYRWAKFYIDEDDNTITVDCDALVQPDYCGRVCLELIYRLVNIIDGAYPDIMRGLWG